MTKRHAEQMAHAIVGFAAALSLSSCADRSREIGNYAPSSEDAGHHADARSGAVEEDASGPTTDAQQSSEPVEATAADARAADVGIAPAPSVMQVASDAGADAYASDTGADAYASDAGADAYASTDGGDLRLSAEDCALCRRSTPGGCVADLPVQWECSGAPPRILNILATDCQDMGTALPRYCCGLAAPACP